MVSDLFTERSQFEMMYLTLTELRRAHPPEDEILLQYLVPATCKAAAVLGMVSRRVRASQGRCEQSAACVAPVPPPGLLDPWFCRVPVPKEAGLHGWWGMWPTPAQSALPVVLGAPCCPAGRSAPVVTLCPCPPPQILRSVVCSEWGRGGGGGRQAFF